MGLTAFEEVYPDVLSMTLTSTDSTTPKALTFSSNQKERMDHIVLTSTAAGDHYVSLNYRISGVNLRVGCCLVPAGAGYAAVPAVDMLASITALGAQMFATPTVGIYVGCDVTLGAGETIRVTGIGGLL